MNINSVRNFLQWLCYRIRELLIKIKSIATFQICEARWRGTGDRKIYHKLFTPRVLEQYSVFGKQKSNFSCSLRILFFSRKNTDNFLVKAISSPEGVWSERNFFFNTSEQSLAIHDAFKCVGYARYKGSSMYRDCQVSESWVYSDE